MQKKLHPAILVAGIVLMLGVAIFLFMKGTGPAEPPAGSYTPGVPPWMEKKSGAQEGVHTAPTRPGG